MRRTLIIIVNSAMALVLLIVPVVAREPGKTFVVTSIADSGPGTLRQALQDAQNGDTITFDSTVFPPDTPATISLARELPYITQGNMTIDASDAGVVINGSMITTPEANGLSIKSNNNVIRGLQIVDFAQAGGEYKDKLDEALRLVKSLI